MSCKTTPTIRMVYSMGMEIMMVMADTLTVGMISILRRSKQGVCEKNGAHSRIVSQISSHRLCDQQLGLSRIQGQS